MSDRMVVFECGKCGTERAVPMPEVKPPEPPPWWATMLIDIPFAAVVGADGQVPWAVARVAENSRLGWAGCVDGLARRAVDGVTELSPDSVIRLLPPSKAEVLAHPEEFAAACVAATTTHAHRSDVAGWEFAKTWMWTAKVKVKVTLQDVLAKGSVMTAIEGHLNVELICPTFKEASIHTATFMEMRHFALTMFTHHTNPVEWANMLASLRRLLHQRTEYSARLREALGE